MIDNKAQCYCGHDFAMHWRGRGCAGDSAYTPALHGTGGDTCKCIRFDHWPEGE